jgi:hypothetical protein
MSVVKCDLCDNYIDYEWSIICPDCKLCVHEAKRLRQPDAKRCPKCGGHDIHKRWISCQHFECWHGLRNEDSYACDELGNGEHFHLLCSTCGYHWAEACEVKP